VGIGWIGWTPIFADIVDIWTPIFAPAINWTPIRKRNIPLAESDAGGTAADFWMKGRCHRELDGIVITELNTNECILTCRGQVAKSSAQEMVGACEPVRGP
jgi:hypothetical protein